MCEKMERFQSVRLNGLPVRTGHHDRGEQEQTLLPVFRGHRCPTTTETKRKRQPVTSQDRNGEGGEGEGIQIHEKLCMWCGGWKKLVTLATETKPRWIQRKEGSPSIPEASTSHNSYDKDNSCCVCHPIVCSMSFNVDHS